MTASLSPNPDLAHDSLATMLDTLGVPVSASEAHGMLCGLLCTQTEANAKTRWFAELLDAANVAPAQLASRVSDVRLLDAWFAVTLGSLGGADFGFQPMLPDDDRALVLRVRGMAEFCAGVNYGLGIGIATRGSRPLPEDTAEIIRDFQRIEATDADDSSLAADHENEQAFVELVEYVRVGVLLILEELRPDGTANLAAGTRPPHTALH